VSYSIVQVDEIEGGGPGGGFRFVVPVAGPEGMALLAVGAPRGSYEPRGPF